MSGGSGSGRRLDIQGLRALAVVLVVAYHADLPIPGGFVGVDVFFVISGFVISAMLLRSLGSGRGVGFRAFYTRRFRRLLPALAATTTIVALASVALLSPIGPLQATVRTGVAASLFAANLQLSQVPTGGYFDLATEANALLHTWSLSVEEQFYLVFPAFLLLAWRLAARGRGRPSPRIAGAIISLALVGSFLLCVVLTYRPSSRLGSPFAFYASPTRAWEFGVGVLLAMAVARLRRLPAAVGQVLLLVGLALVLAAAFGFSASTTFPGLAAALPVAGTALMIAGGTATAGGLARGLATRPAVWIGDVSYGWYLWHWPLIVFAAAWWPGQRWATVAAALVALVPTVVSYRLLEQPIRTDDTIVGRRVVKLVAVCIVVPIVACGVAEVAGRAMVQRGRTGAFADDVAEHADRARGCDEPVSLPDREGEDCTWTVDGADGELVLLGDSNAGHFTEPVVAAGNAAGLDVTVATSAGCPFADVIRRETFSGDFDGEACHDRTMASVEELVARQPELVVIAMSSTEYVQDPVEHLRRPDGPEASDPAGKAAVYEDGLAEVVGRLRAAGIPVLVVHTVPQFGAVLGDAWSAETCPALKVWIGASCGGSRSLADVQADQALAAGAEAAAVEGDGAAPALAIGFDDELCPDGRCATERGDRLVYRDATHLSIPGAEALTDRFAAAIAQLRTS